jgi:hypothetical protein
MIEKALLQLARLRSVKSISNIRSPLSGKITIKPVRLTAPIECGADGAITAAKKEAVKFSQTSRAYQFRTGEIFWLEIANASNRDVYITLLDIGSDGGVQILFPGKTDGEKEGFKLAAKTGKRIVLSDKCEDGWPAYLRITPPAGIETFKIIATTEPAPRRKFEFLEMNSLNSITRGEETSLLNVGDWTTAEINFEIETPK